MDLVLEGTTDLDDPSAATDRVRAMAEAGATWWIESDWSTFAIEDMRRRIESGPPAID